MCVTNNLDLTDMDVLTTFLENPDVIERIEKQAKALSKYNPTVDYQDLLNSGYLAVHEKLDKYDVEKGDFMAFVCETARFRMLNEINKQRTYNERFQFESDLNRGIEQIYDLNVKPLSMSQIECQLDVKRLLKPLSNKARFVLMAFYEDIRTTEISKKIDSSVGWTSRLIEKYREEVQESISNDIQLYNQ